MTGFGVLFSFLGILMLFDKGFLAMGNVRIILLVYLYFTTTDSFLITIMYFMLSDSLRVWCFTNHWAEVNRTVLHQA